MSSRERPRRHSTTRLPRLPTRKGGHLIIGVDDNGNIVGTDVKAAVKDPQRARPGPDGGCRGSHPLRGGPVIFTSRDADAGAGYGGALDAGTRRSLRGPAGRWRRPGSSLHRSAAGSGCLIRELFSDEVNNGGGECQSFLSFLLIERFIWQTSRDPVRVASRDIIQVKNPCPRDGIESAVERRSPVQEVRDGMTRYFFLSGEVKKRLDSFFCRLLG